MKVEDMNKIKVRVIGIVKRVIVEIDKNMKKEKKVWKIWKNIIFRNKKRKEIGSKGVKIDRNMLWNKGIEIKSIIEEERKIEKSKEEKVDNIKC